MRVHDCNWQMLEKYLSHDDRIVLPIGSTEQHGYLSVGPDAILGRRPTLREGVLPWLVDGKLPVDAHSRRRDARWPETADPAACHPAGTAGRAAPSDRRRQLRWFLPPTGSGSARALEHRCRGGPRSDRERVEW